MTRFTRRIALLAHVVSAGLWLGIDVTLGILACTALLTGDTGVEAACLRALGIFAVWPLFAAALATFGTGVLLGLGTRYGLLRYWWVAVKLVVNVLMAVLILVALRPGIDQAAEHGRLLALGGHPRDDLSGLLFPVFVAPSLLLLANVLSVFKPWGRLRGARSGVVCTGPAAQVRGHDSAAVPGRGSARGRDDRPDRGQRVRPLG